MHVEVISSIPCPFERQLPAVHLAAVNEGSIAERAPSSDDRCFPQIVLDNVMKSQDARLVRFGNSIFTHANYAIVALQKVRLRCWNEVRIAERHNWHGETALLLLLLRD